MGKGNTVFNVHCTNILLFRYNGLTVASRAHDMCSW